LLLSRAGYLLLRSDLEAWSESGRILDGVIGSDSANFSALTLKACSLLFRPLCRYEAMLPEDVTLAHDLAHRAIRPNEQSDFAHAVLGGIYLHGSGDLAAAHREYQRSLELNPQYVLGMEANGAALIFMGQLDEGMALCGKAAAALNRAPNYHRAVQHVALGNFARGRYDAAIDWGQRGVHQSPEFAPGHLVVAAAAALSGRTSLARDSLAHVLRLNPSLVSTDLWCLPFRDDAIWQDYLSGLRVAGLPD
jgi:tetratricopeptide (TPR) repeat protein